MADEMTYNSNSNMDDIVFENRNKEYGAYDLRKNYSRYLTKALIIGLIIFLIPVLSAVASNKIKNMNKKAKEEVVADMIDLEEEEEPIFEEKQEEEPPPPPPEEEEVKQEIIQDIVPEPKVNPPKEVPPPKLSEKLETTTGTFNQEGEKTTAYVPPPPPPSPNTGKGKTIEAKPPVDDKKVYYSVDQEAEFPGGINKFRTFIAENFDQDVMDGDEGVVKSTVTFVVEKDGTISDIKASGPNKYFNEEAIRTIKANKAKWKPGKVNGKPVRSRFRVPIAMQFEY